MMGNSLKLYKILGIFFAVKLLVSCNTSGQSQQSGLNFISEIKGTVEVKYNGNSKYEKIYPGDTLNPSDKLRLSKNASAKVMCNNLSVWEIDSQGEFPVSKGCPSTKTPVFRKHTLTDKTRAANNSNIPYLISPRNTAILNGKPTLSWNPVAGASYRVQIFSLGEEFNWTTEVGEATVVYSGNKPMPPGFYKVNITASNGASTKDKDDSVFFIMPDEKDISQINAYVEELQQKPLSNSSKILALAHLYRSYDFKTKAIELLEELVEDGNQITAVHQLLGSIYKQIGLNELAKERYLKAKQLAKAEGDLKAQENIQSELVLLGGS